VREARCEDHTSLFGERREDLRSLLQQAFHSGHTAPVGLSDLFTVSNTELLYLQNCINIDSEPEFSGNPTGGCVGLIKETKFLKVCHYIPNGCRTDAETVFFCYRSRTDGHSTLDVFKDNSL
jgi:hypothetical protein